MLSLRSSLFLTLKLNYFKVGFAKSITVESDVRLAVTWPTDYFTSDGTFAKSEELEQDRSQLYGAINPFKLKKFAGF